MTDTEWYPTNKKFTNIARGLHKFRKEYEQQEKKLHEAMYNNAHNPSTSALIAERDAVVAFMEFSLRWRDWCGKAVGLLTTWRMEDLPNRNDDPEANRLAAACSAVNKALKDRYWYYYYKLHGEIGGR